MTDVSMSSQTGLMAAVNTYTTVTYKFRHAFIGASAGILVAFILLFHLATAFALQKLDFFKRYIARCAAAALVWKSTHELVSVDLFLTGLFEA